jgi:hypothetical protein
MTFKVRMVLLALVAVFVASAAASAVASAQTGPVWYVEGSQLKAGSTVAITDENAAGENAVLEGSLIGTPIRIECKTVTSEGELIGGNPGKNKETISFTSCKDVKNTKCSVTVPPAKVRSELDHSVSGSKMLVDFAPNTKGGVFMTIKYDSDELCVLKNKSLEVRNVGTDTYGVAAEISPEGTEATEETLIFPTTPIKEVEQSGAIWKIGLEFSKNSISLSLLEARVKAGGKKFGVKQS